MNWTPEFLSHNLVFLFCLISLANHISIPLLNMYFRSSVSSLEPAGFLIFSPFNYVQVPNLSFFRVLLPRLGWRSKIYSLSSRQSPVKSHSSHQQSLPHQISPTSFSHRRLVGDFSIFYRHFNGHCYQEIRDISQVPLMRVRTTRSSTHSHSFKPTSCLLLAFQYHTALHLSNLKSMNFILFPLL